MVLFDYLQKIKLPNPIFEAQGNVIHLFLNKQVLSLWEAIYYTHQLPYGRTVDRSNYLQVLEEQRGACSGKHALIAALAQELSVPLKLIMGIFLLTTKNTPKIAPILEHYRIEAIPEAHCYLAYDDNTLDITFPNVSEFSIHTKPLQEISMNPQQIGSFKVKQHQEFIRAWVADRNDLNFDLVWMAREEWIKELSLG